MAGRSFAMIRPSLLKSKKVRECDHPEKYAYLCTHFTSLGNSVGNFNYPMVMWAQDACVKPDKMPEIIARLIEIELIDYDFTEEIIRIIGFLRKSPPTNASWITSILKHFAKEEHTTGKSGEMRIANIAEMVVASMHHSQKWNPEKRDFQNLIEMMETFLKSIFAEHGKVFLEALEAELEHYGKSTRLSMELVLPPLLNNASPTLCTGAAGTLSPHGTEGADTLSPQIEKKEKERKKQIDEYLRSASSRAIISTNTEKSECNVADQGKLDVTSERKVQSGPMEETKRSRLAKGI